MARLNALGINIYGGGFTMGVSDHFNVIGQWEEITLGRDTFTMNFPHIFRPLKREDWPVEDHIGQVPFIYANPPCVAWSAASTTKKIKHHQRQGDLRLKLTHSTMTTALRINPQIFISESVENAYNIGKEHYHYYRDLFIEDGYHVTYFLTDAIIHGAACKRRRFHFIAHRYRLPFVVPNMEGFKPTTVRDVIGDLEHTVGQNGDRHHQEADTRWKHKPYFPEVLPGKPLCFHPICQTPGYRSTFLIKRFLWDAPSHTLVGLEYIHLNGTRLITHREGLRLLSFPDTYFFARVIDAVDTVIPLIGRYLGAIAEEALEERDPIAPGFTVVDWRPLGKPYHIAAMLKKGVK